MPPEDDVPTGNQAPNYYEGQFADKINQIRKPSAPPPGGQGSGGLGRVGGGTIVVVVIIVIKILVAIGRTNSGSTPPPSFHFPQPSAPAFDPDEARRNRFQGEEVPPLPGGFGRPGLGADVDVNACLLDRDDVPFPRGLCYRIYHESQGADPAPGRRVWELLDPTDRGLIRLAATGKALGPQWEDALCESLNRVLGGPRLYAADCFREVKLDPRLKIGLVALGMQGRRGPHSGSVLKMNRLLLEAAYEDQVVPCREKGQLDDDARKGWQERARLDFEAARRKYEPGPK